MNKYNYACSLLHWLMTGRHTIQLFRDLSNLRKNNQLSLSPTINRLGHRREIDAELDYLLAACEFNKLKSSALTVSLG